MNSVKTNGDNEATSYPWWAIVNPRPGLVRKQDAVGHFASAITGPFFSRESAEEVLRTRPHRFSKDARVFCFSGHMSDDYCEALKNGAEVSP